MDEKFLVSPEVAATWAADKKSIHSPDFATIGALGTAQAGEVINQGLVVDVDAARDIATVRNEMGDVAADAREKQLERESKDGLSDQQREYVKIMEENLKFNKNGEAINTHAFKEVMDDKGRKYLVLNMTPHDTTVDVREYYKPGFLVLMSKDGPIGISTTLSGWGLDNKSTVEDVIRKLDLVDLGDKLERPEENKLPALGDGGRMNVVLNDGQSKKEVDVYAYRYNLSIPDEFNDFKNAVAISELRGKNLVKSNSFVKASDLSFG